MTDEMWRRSLYTVGTRRDFLALSGSLTAALALRGLPGTRADARPRLRAYPFTLGVASGDPTPDGFVLWTRLAPDPTNGGGMPASRVAVDWEIAADDTFRRIVRKGSAVATPDLAHAVHVDVAGLEPGRFYWYRFHTGGETSPVGRTRTAPVITARDPLRFAFCSCQHYEQGLYTAYAHMAQEDLHVVVHLGDYIYEGGPGNNVPRAHIGPEIESILDYRNRYALYKSDEHLRAAHAAFPFILTWDDHEVDNNYAGDSPEGEQTAEAFLRRRAAAYQAYFEHQPLRSTSRPSGPDMRLYRRLRFGSVAEFSVLDTRQYRTNQPCGDGMKANCAGAADPNATILGDAQRGWLTDGLARSEAAWNVLASQVPIAPQGRMREGALEQSMDKWSAYLADRDRLLAFLHDRRVRNPISIVGDVHVNWLADLRTRYYDDRGVVIGAEFVGTSISSGGDGRDVSTTTPQMMSTNPHIKFYNGQRGYVRCTVTPEKWTADYRIVDYVLRPGANISTRASFVVEDGAGGAQKA
jgi:alkaline phosphatase D